MARMMSVVLIGLVPFACSTGPFPSPPGRSAASGGWERVDVPGAGEVGGPSDVAVIAAGDAWAVGDLGEDVIVGSFAINRDGSVPAATYRASWDRR